MSAVTFTKDEAVKRLAKKIDLSKLTKNQARVEIAKDVIAGIKAKTLRASHTYADLDLGPGARMIDRNAFRKATEKFDYDSGKWLGDGKIDWKDTLAIPNVRCDVCAIGACFAATVRRENKFSSRNNSVDREEVVHRMRSYFTDDQLTCLESAYESGDEEWDPEWADMSTVGKWDRFGRGLGSDDDKRMINLMLYIIEHDGKIVTPKFPKAKSDTRE